jgi:predicted metal-dependent hydrolase
LKVTDFDTRAKNPAVAKEMWQPMQPGVVQLRAATVPLRVISSPRARRYLLRLDTDGAVRLVIPRRGSRTEAMRFLDRSRDWLERRVAAWRSREHLRQPWNDGASLLYRGEPVRLHVASDRSGVTLSFADQSLPAGAPAADYRGPIQAHLRSLAEGALPPRARELARLHGITIGRVTVRAQKTRWGSCSARGTISLNWRLIQAPPFVQDYLIIHELMHRRQMNHSARFWKLVADACPNWREAESWLKKTRLENLA